MRRNNRMQKVVMVTLAAMLFASLVLAVASFVWPEPAYAEHYCYNAYKCEDHILYWCWRCCDAYDCRDIWCNGVCNYCC